MTVETNKPLSSCTIILCSVKLLEYVNMMSASSHAIRIVKGSKLIEITAIIPESKVSTFLLQISIIDFVHMNNTF